MNAIVELKQPAGLVAADGRMSAQQVLQHALTVQEVMRSVMRPDVHYGTIPGTDKPTLYQPGADVLCMTFRIAQRFAVEDLSTADAIRYRVTCTGTHQATGVELGTGIGEGSTSEEKYKWRRAVTDEEFDATPPAMRRTKYGRKFNTKQVRTEPADVANTVLKMAAKRAKIAMVLNVTAASDMFGQDLEDLDAALRDSLTGADSGATAPPPPPPAAPSTWPDQAFNGQLQRWAKAVAAGMKTSDDILALARSKGALTPSQEAQIRALVKAPDPEPAAGVEPEKSATDEFVAGYESAEQQQ